MNRGFSAIGFLLGSLAVIGIAVGAGYVVIEQKFKVSNASQPVAPLETVEQSEEKTAPLPTSTPVVQKSAAVDTKTSIETKAAAPAKPKPVVQKAPAPAAKTGGFYVRKVPAGFVLDVTIEEPTLHLAVTTEPRAEDPATLSLCWTVVDPQDVVLSETDCWPLEKYGTWEASINYDHSLAPSPEGNAYYKYGHNMVKLRFDLVGPGSFQMADGPSADAAILGSGDTGVYDYYIPEGTQL